MIDTDDILDNKARTSQLRVAKCVTIPPNSEPPVSSPTSRARLISMAAHPNSVGS